MNIYIYLDLNGAIIFCLYIQNNYLMISFASVFPVNIRGKNKNYSRVK